MRYRIVWYVMDDTNKLSLPDGAIVIGERYQGDGMTTLFKKNNRWFYYNNNGLLKEYYTEYGKFERQLEVLVPDEKENQ